MPVYKALYISPMIPSRDPQATMRFFVDLFGFSVLMEGNYCIVKKDGHLIQILRAGPDIGEMEIYLEVDDITALWDSVQDQLTDLKVKLPFDRDYGMREFHIVIPHTNTLLFVGQALTK